MEVFKYELMIVAKASAAEALAERVEKVVGSGEGSAVSLNRLGRKRLGYPIKKQTDAEYYLFNFDAPASSVALITNKLRLEQEDLLRFLLLKVKHKRFKKKVNKVEAVFPEAPKTKVTVITKTKTSQSKTKSAKKVDEASKVDVASKTKRKVEKKKVSKGK